MIGGADIFLETPVDDTTVDFVVRFFRNAWRDSIVNVPSESVEIRMQFYQCQSPPNDLELFIYESRQARERWRAEGLTDEGAASMVFATFEPDGISFVVDDVASPSGVLVSELRASLLWNQRLRTATYEPEDREAA